MLYSFTHLSFSRTILQRGLKHKSNVRNFFCVCWSQNYLRDSKSYTIDSHLPKHLNLCERKESHCVKYARIQVFSNPHFPVRRQNRRFCCILTYFTQCHSDVSEKKQINKQKKKLRNIFCKPFKNRLFFIPLYITWPYIVLSEIIARP